MSEYKIELGVGLVQSDLDKIKNQIKTLETDGIKIKLDSGDVKTNVSSIVKQMQQSGSEAGSGFAKGFNNSMSSITATANNSANTIQHMRDVLAKAKFNNSSINAVTKDLSEMSLEIQNVTTRINGNNLNLTVRGLDELGRAVTIVKQFDYQSGNITSVGKTISQTFETSADAAKRFQKEIDAAFSQLSEKATEMKNLKIKIAGLDADKNKNEIAELTSQLDKLQAEYNELYAATSKSLNNDQIKALNQTLSETESKINVVNAKMSDTSAVKNQTQAYNDLLSKVKEMNNLKIKIAGLDATENAGEIDNLRTKLKEATADFQAFKNIYSGTLTNNQWGTIQAEIDETEAKLRDLAIQKADTDRSLANAIKLKLESSDFSKQIAAAKTSVSSLSGDYQDLTIGIGKVETALRDMEVAAGTEDEVADVEKLISSYKKFQEILTTVTNKQKEYKQEEQRQSNSDSLGTYKESALLRLKLLFGENSEAAKMFATDIQRIQNEIEQCGNKSGFSKINKDIDNLSKKAQVANAQTKTFTQSLKEQWDNYKSYLSVASIIMYATQAFKSMFEQVKAIDSAMTELKKVTDETDASYNQFLTNAASRAKEIGTTIDGLVASTADFARLGYGFEDAQGLAEVANIYAVVGDEVEGVEGATESLISTMAAFKDEMGGLSNADFAMSIIDVFNEIGNNFAISSGGLGEALERSASSLAAANNTLQESAALITAANVVTQDPEKVGNAMKTISMRIRGATTE